MKKIYKTNNAKETILLGKRIGNLLAPKDVVLLTGDLSAGKTTITKGIGEALGVKKTINSPTFTIVKEYQGKYKLFHLDLYRLDGLNNDFDLEEYIESEGICVIEWPYQIEEILPKEYIEINLKRLSEFDRVIEIKALGIHYEEVLKKL